MPVETWGFLWGFISLGRLDATLDTPAATYEVTPADGVILAEAA